jgi:GAF domain-containing protein
VDKQQQGWSEQQDALAEFGQFALSSLDLDLILQRACELVARGLQAPVAKILQTLPGSDDLLIRAAVGLPPGTVAGVTTVPGGRGSAAGYALLEGEPIISHIPTEIRFEVSEVVRRSNVVVSANVLIGGASEASVLHGGGGGKCSGGRQRRGRLSRRRL